ncbi:hypothetical protein CGCSCA4_v002123 [Colletotrichum siamense]|uniref:Uncharacterized protein n=3 Tax=Colletotrichum gloeosporioides species complex TaxID=2707338 RepID=A0A9W4RRD9_9PEZI|nr:hypothetical protein CGCSCA5_v010113 [Colletotrichum siamense]KAF4922585.1 hypothetical protein CGCVW01_v005169 [Colletotrichum viniferum]KAH9238388.1 hypothetical protein K456DRAFT_1720077 [Colletotrichum gloeosporioides 23]CAI0646055.1 unnamed protein product [Colletotrichum noveboracense]KAF4853553.1 hypothetical protein CGCSCA4_v002123 [Colletotrichum siamense]
MKLFLPLFMFAAAAYAASPETLMEFQMDLRDPYNPLTLRGHPPDCGDENEGENGGPVGDNGGSPSPGQGSSGRYNVCCRYNGQHNKCICLARCRADCNAGICLM